MDDITRRPAKGRDPLRVNERLYDQIDKLLEQLENPGDTKIALKERVAALIAIGRLQIMFVGLRKEKSPDVATGSAVRKYAAAFTHAPRGRKGRAAQDEDLGGGPDGGDEYLAEALGGDDDDTADSR